METKALKKLSEYLNEPLFDDYIHIYRGVADSKYELIPSVGRYKAKDLQSHLIFEVTVFREFKQRAARYLSHQPDGDFEWLFLAQNYGIPTRLLDWTTNPLVALYFACEKHPERESAVYKCEMPLWYRDVESFGPQDEEEEDDHPFRIREIGGLRPRHIDLRYVNQSGVFTIHPNPTEAADLPGIKFVFDAESKDIIRWQLRKLGIHSTLIYPSLDSVARDIVHEFDGLLDGGRVRHSGLMEAVLEGLRSSKS